MVDLRLRGIPLGAIGFWSGLATGVALPLLVSGVLAAVLAINHDPSRYLAQIRSSGAALTSRGGAHLVLKESYETFSQDCRGACDDIELDSNVAPYGYEGRVLDADGHCVACEWKPMTGQGKAIRSSLAGGGVVQTTH